METTLTWATMFTLIILLALYFSMGIRFMRKPMALITIGVLLCLLSALMQFIFDDMTTYLNAEIDKAIVDFSKNIFMISIASLSGGLICTGITNKAAIEHNKHITYYRSRLEDIENELISLHILRERTGLNEEQKEIYNHKIAMKEAIKEKLLSTIKEIENP